MDHTGRIGSRRQLAECAWLVSLGCSGGAQRACGDHLHIIQLGLQGKPIFRKIGRFPLCACGNGVNLPQVAKHAFGNQVGPNVQNPMLPGSPPHQGQKNSGFSQKKSAFDQFFCFWQFPPFLRGWHCFEAGILFGSIRVTKCNVDCRENPIL